jgi:AcrR family transcriptional regulator
MGPPSSRRQRQAQLTRDDILGAARSLFAERGYAATTIRDIAQAAGVSAQTVYDSVGPKQALVARLNDLVDAEAGIAALGAAGVEATDPRDVLAASARIARSIVEHCGDILRALVTGAAAEADLAGVLAEGQRRHVSGATMLAGRLHALGALAEGVDVEAAAATLAAISDVRVALMLRDDYGWSLDRIEGWIASSASTLLLADPAARGA